MQQNHSDSSRLAQHALVLAPSGHVEPDPILSAKSAQSVDSAIQSDPLQESVKPESPCLASRASAIKEQGFSVAVAPQRVSTRSVYEAKWKNSKVQNGCHFGRDKKFLKIGMATLQRYPVGQKFRLNRSI